MPAWLVLGAALSLAASASASADVSQDAARDIAIDVPYLTQPEALCGGAAVAMVFRYWGDAHADVQQFAPLVDVRAGGIADTSLVDAVAARGWQATPVAGSIDLLREQLEARRPIIILVQNRPTRYHYVVVTGIDESAVTYHDPAIGPSRRMRFADLNRAWQPAHFWGLVILPGESRRGERAASGARAPSGEPRTVTAAATDCDRLLEDAVADVRRRGVDAADEIFGTVRSQCPHASAPISELAGVRFAQRRWREAALLAGQSLAVDAHDAYAWDVLASSRFMQDDLAGSLDAWNHVGKPQIDSVRIQGVQRTRYELLTRALGLTTNTLLTEEAFTRASRRLAELPDDTSTRLSYKPGEDGFATVDVAVAERSPYPRGAAQWAATAARVVVNREADVSVPGPTGQGEVWEASWRWWANRPRAALSFVTPRVGWMPGIWRVDGSWEAQTYATDRATAGDRVRETRAHGGLSVSDWLTSDLRYELKTGVDAWDAQRRTASIGGGLQRRLAADRLAVFGDVEAWIPLTAGAAFHAASARALFNTSPNPTRWLFTADAGVDAVGSSAPFALWPGAGDGHARPALLRAHPLLDDGVVTGPAFGRTLRYANAETQWWLERGALVRLGWAAFADLARASRGMDRADPRTQLDVGIGLRIRVPGTAGTLRADVATGLRDGAHAVTVGWQR